MIISAAGCNSSGGKSNDGSIPEDRQYSFWFFVGSEQYSDYEENPGVDYFKSRPYGTDNKGQEKFIDIKINIPVAGSERDSFNTMIATGDYMDVLDLTAYSGKAINLYEEGIAMDITDYVEDFMPNYRAFLEANPNLKATATNIIDGEPRFIQIFTYLDSVGEMWGGYQYRRDWIVKYGRNPVDGSAFSGAFADVDQDGRPHPDSWEDNVVFPSGGSDPVYISDWEWMLEIFDLALQDLGITNGYGMSLYFPGYLETGDLVCAFGGGNATWHLNQDNEIVYGGTSNSFRTYLQAMSNWYKKGWIDPDFTSRTSDMFYQIDSAKIYSGQVGLWWGLMASLGNRLADPDEPFLDGFVSFTAAQPINDLYGTANEQNKTPFAMYQQGRESTAYIITSAAKDKDLETLFTFLDYLYTEEGGAIRFFGLSKEQYELTQNKFMTEHGLTEGIYKKVEESDGVIRYQVFKEVIDKGLESAVKAERFPGLDLYSLRGKSEFHPGFISSKARWTEYTNTGWLSGSFTGQLSADQSQAYTRANLNVSEFMTRSVPPFITGAKDPFSDQDWNAFVNALNKYSPDRVTSAFQELADTLYAK